MQQVFEVLGAFVAYCLFKLVKGVGQVIVGLAKAVPTAIRWVKDDATVPPREEPVAQAEEQPAVALPRRVLTLAIKPGYSASVSIHPEGVVEAVLRSEQEVGGRKSWFLLGTKTDAAGLGSVIATIEKAAFQRILEVEAKATAAQAAADTSVEAPQATAAPRVLELVVKPDAKASSRKTSKADKPAAAVRKPVAVGKVIEASMAPSAMHPEGLFTLVVDDPTGEPRLLRGPAVQDAWERSCLEVGDSIRASKEVTQPGTFQMATGSVSTEETPVYFIEKEVERV